MGLGTRLVKLKLFNYLLRDNYPQLADKGIPQVVAPCTVYYYTVHCTTVYALKLAYKLANYPD